MQKAADRRRRHGLAASTPPSARKSSTSIEPAVALVRTSLARPCATMIGSTVREG
jgi:hypothetical protein